MSRQRDIWAVVPVKAFGDAKTRLAPELSGAMRSRLATAMLEDVLDALTHAHGIAGFVVVTVDPQATRIASARGATIVATGATDGHTVAVMTAARRLQHEGREGMLTVPGDIPAVRATEIDALLERHRDAPAFTIVPSHDGRGSNAIVTSPPLAVPLAFGNDSFAPHVDAARRAGIEPTIVTGLEGIERDVDCHDDLVALLRMRRTMTVRSLLQPDDAANAGPGGAAVDQR